MKKNTKVLLLAGAATMFSLVMIAAFIMVVSRFFNIANVVSGGN